MRTAVAVVSLLGLALVLPRRATALDIDLLLEPPGDTIVLSLFYVHTPERTDDHCMDNGADYFGSLATTVTGKPCARWPDDEIAPLDQVWGLELGAYCRNPDNSDAPWCYVEGGQREACNVSAWLREPSLRFYDKESFNRSDITTTAAGGTCDVGSHCAYDTRRNDIGCEVDGKFVPCGLKECCTACGSTISQIPMGTSTTVEVPFESLFHTVELGLASGYYRLRFQDSRGDPFSALSGAVRNSNPSVFWSLDRSIVWFRVFEADTGVADCVDTPTFVDVQGFPCSAWQRADCGSAVSQFGYSMQDTIDLVANCPVSCGVFHGQDCASECIVYVLKSMENVNVADFSNCDGALVGSVVVDALDTTSGMLCGEDVQFGVSVDFLEASDMWFSFATPAIDFVVEGDQAGFSPTCARCMVVDQPVSSSMAIRDCSGDIVTTLQFTSITDRHLVCPSMQADGLEVEVTDADDFGSGNWSVSMGSNVFLTAPYNVGASSCRENPNSGTLPLDRFPRAPPLQPWQVPAESGVFVSYYGDDSSDGQAPNTPVQTLSRALELGRRVFVMPDVLVLSDADEHTFADQVESCVDLTMLDQYGDGWNGAEFSVLSCTGETLAGPVTMQSGSSSTTPLCFDALEAFEILVTEGDYPEEVSWEIAELGLSGGPGVMDRGCAASRCTDSQVYVQVLSAATTSFAFSACDGAFVANMTIGGSSLACIDASLLSYGFRVLVSAPTATPDVVWSIHDADGGSVFDVAGGQGITEWQCTPRADFHVQLNAQGPSQLSVVGCGGEGILSLEAADGKHNAELTTELSEGFVVYCNATSSSWSVRHGDGSAIVPPGTEADTGALVLAAGGLALENLCPFACEASELEFLSTDSATLTACDGGGVDVRVVVQSLETGLTRGCVQKSAVADGIHVDTPGFFQLRRQEAATVILSGHGSMSECVSDPRDGDGLCDGVLNVFPDWDDGDCCAYSCLSTACKFSDFDCRERTVELYGIPSVSGGKPTVVASAPLDHLLRVGEGGGVVLHSLRFEAVALADSLIVADRGATVAIESCEFVSLRGSTGAVVSVSDATLSISHSEIAQSDVVSIGGAILAEGASVVTIEGTVFANNSAGVLGGDIVASDTTTVELVECTLSQSRALAGGSIAMLGGSLVLRNTTQQCAMANAGGCIFAVGTRVRVTNSSVSGHAMASGGAVFLDLQSSLTLANSVLAQSSAVDGGAVFCKESEVVMSDSTVLNNTATTGGGVLANDCNVTLSTSAFHNNTASQRGGGVFCASRVTIANCVFSRNRAAEGGGVFVSPAGGTYIAQTTFANNVADESGGGCALVDEGDEARADVHGTFTNNQATNGAGLYVEDLELVMAPVGSGLVKDSSSEARSVFAENVAAGEGGGLQCAGCTASVTCVARGNTAQKGGAIHFEGDAAALYNSEFDSNSAVDGGAILAQGVQLNCTLSTFQSNTASDRGGAVHAVEWEGVVSSTSFSSNHATSGGAVWATLNGLEMNLVVVEHNVATLDGGGAWLSSGSVRARGAVFRNNTAEGEGGAMLLVSLPQSSVVEESVFSSNTASLGGAIRAFLSAAQFANLTLSHNAAVSGGALSASASTIPFFRNVTVEHNSASSYGGGVYLVESTLTMSDCVVRANAATFGGGILATQGTSGPLSLDRVVVSENTAREGGGVAATDVSLVAVSSAITDNSASRCGGAIVSRGAVRLLASALTSNHADSGDGGGLCAENFQSLLVRDSVVASNVGAGDGGGLFLSSAISTNNTVERTNVTDNVAGQSGGAAFSLSVEWVARDCVFTGNTASGSGGAVAVTDSSLLASGTFAGNFADRVGGAMYAGPASSLFVSNAQLTNNDAVDGGAVGTESAAVRIADSDFLFNQALRNGGAVNVDGGSLALIGGTFLSNAAVNGSGGGAFLLGTTEATIANSTFSSNSASQGGGALYWMRTSVDYSTSAFANNTAKFGGSYGSGVVALGLVSHLTSDPVEGQFFEGWIEMTLRDDLGQVTSSASAQTATVEVSSSDTSLVGSRIASFDGGTAIFDSLALAHGCGNTYTLLFSVPTLVVPVEAMALQVYLACTTETMYREAITIPAALFAAADLLLMYLIVANRRSPLVAHSSPQFCVSQLLGDLVLLSGVIAFGFEPSEAMCQSSLFLWSAGFTIAYGSLFLKTWRIMRVFANENMGAVVMPNSFLFGWLSAMLLWDVLLLSVSFAVWPPTARTYLLDSSQTQFRQCDFRVYDSPLMVILVLSKLLLVLFGVVISYRVSRAFADGSMGHRADYNESKYIGYCLYNVFFLLCIVVPVLLAVGESQWKLQDVLLAVSLMGTSQFNAFLLFPPKIARLYQAVPAQQKQGETGQEERDPRRTSRLRSLMDPGVVIQLQQQQQQRRPTPMLIVSSYEESDNNNVA